YLGRIQLCTGLQYPLAVIAGVVPDAGLIERDLFTPDLEIALGRRVLHESFETATEPFFQVGYHGGPLGLIPFGFLGVVANDVADPVASYVLDLQVLCNHPVPAGGLEHFAGRQLAQPSARDVGNAQLIAHPQVRFTHHAPVHDHDDLGDGQLPTQIRHRFPEHGQIDRVPGKHHVGEGITFVGGEQPENDLGQIGALVPRVTVGSET